MSVVLFDLGQRLRAATLARPVARSTFAPVLPPIDPVAITLTGAGDSATVRATDGTRVTTGTGSGVLSPLAELGVSIGAEPRTLIVADRDTLSRLIELARSTDPASSSAASAAVEPAGRPSRHRCRAERHRRLLRPLGARRATR